MGTSIVSGDRVLVKPSVHPRYGEVWAFCNAESSIVVHRFRGRRRESLLFEGDTVGQADPAVPSSWLIGRVVSVRRGDIVRDLGRWDRMVGSLAIAIRRVLRAFRRTIRRVAGRGGHSRSEDEG